ncbi:uncharacterized protein GGS22DRAFT_175324 [Annulohypoxylon maeteangense]|uniref:uncharacterized protein n=1 Tax=Annulohypoxylon maeteangense TaxID=1927788 RepID=UPI0020085EA3|nr:uncharacterized protein GGS22DRAFT_175324 [Annulohypoxylon maeteangense]KAI0880313.1 hypothetical protein GGS22DRAFT_175324 [Annulohypoxylon maeteangense]
MTYAQPDVQTSDELAAMFSRNLTLHPQPVQAQETPRPQQLEPEITYSISQHYHHSAHLVHQDEPPVEHQRPSSEPPQTQEPSAESILNKHGINHTGLSASQLELFKTAEDSQKLRLIQLWQICPPSNAQDNPAAAWSNTTVEQEEFLAQLRYERRVAEEEQKNSIMSMDGTPLTPVQTGDGRWVAMTDVEPYMMSGYEALARREYEESARQQYQEAMTIPKDVYSHFGTAVGGPTYRPATDPVYDSDWMRQQQAMENQYGAFQQMDSMEL